MNVIKFSHYYPKLELEPNKFVKSATLLHVSQDWSDNLSKEFVKYDTLFWNKNKEAEYYQLPEGRVLILIFKSENKIFTTIRRYGITKEKYYKSNVGMLFDVEIVDFDE